MGTDVHERDRTHAATAFSSPGWRKGVPVGGNTRAVEGWPMIQDAPREEHVPAEPGHGKPAIRSRPSRSSQFAAAGRLEGWLNRVLLQWSRKSIFWYRFGLLLKLPLGFHSGIREVENGQADLAMLLPFRRFNRNWYGAVAGGSLLANVEIAAGTYLLQKYGSRAVIVCKEVSYKFLRPCFTHVVYYIRRQPEAELLKPEAEEFNVTLAVTIAEWSPRDGKRKRRIGKCTIAFHVILRDGTPAARDRLRPPAEVSAAERQRAAMCPNEETP